MWINSKPRGGKVGSRFYALFFLAVMALLAALGPKPAQAVLSINTSNASDWVITNGTLKIDWSSTNGNISAVSLNGVNMVDTTSGKPGVYMDNTGSFGGGATTVGHSQGANYIDWWISFAASATNSFTFTEHFILTNNDTGFSVYCIGAHDAASPTGGLGQIQYVFRINNSTFPNAYYYNLGLNLLGESIIPLPNISASASADPGRNVQNAVIDLHGIAQPAGFKYLYDTKYNRCSYQYLHQADGAYGSKYGIFTVLPSTESLCGGPTHQCLDSEGLLIMECLSGHIDNPLNFTVANGVSESHLWGPFYFHLNQFTTTLTTPFSLYQDSVAAGAAMKPIYDTDTTLVANGYTPTSQRGTVIPTISRAGSATPNTGWVVLSDPSVNTQLSCHGFQYWASENSRGNAPLTGVVPGTYRLSYYQLGQWGEMRNDDVTVAAGQTTSLRGLTFVPENFSASLPIWTIGTPDRSSHEFLHGHDSSGNDDREYQGTFNFWADFAANNGAVIYNATNGPGYTATNNLDDWNYIQWNSFDPGEFGGFYDSTDDTTDGYKYIIPAYAAAMETTSGSIGTAICPPWTVHFTTTAAQSAQGKYVVLSCAMSSVEGDVLPSLNGHQLIWHSGNRSDADVRSGLSGYTQWVVFQWDAADLKPAGQDNVLTLSTNSSAVMYDALRMEITNTSAAPAVRGWHDYEYLYNNTDTLADDSVPNP